MISKLPTKEVDVRYSEMSEVEKQAISVAMEICAYSPTTQWANWAPLHYGLMMAHVRRIMLAFGITPDDNVRAWFWQLCIFKGDDDPPDRKERTRASLESEKSKPSPTLRGGLWYDENGQQLSEADFRRLYPN